MKLSASQAAKETGRSVPTITRAINSGKISAEKVKGGGYLIDPAELFRVFPAVTSNTNATPPSLGSETPNEMGVLQVEVKMLREMLEETRSDRDHWREQAERATKLIPAPQPSGQGTGRAWWRFWAANDKP